MMITKKAINDDIAFIIDTLKNREVMIPSFLSCASPGLAVMFGLPLWQCFVAYPIPPFDKMTKLFAQASICFSFFLGFFIFLMLTSMRGKFLSLPLEVRQQSLLVKLTKRKSSIYVGLWFCVNILAGILIKLLDIDALLSSGMQLVSLVFIWFIAAVDMGRYDLTVFSSVTKAWRDGDKLDPEQLKELDI
ncbi:TPA: conjugal transfer entry exclusion protein TraS [Aeromonas veronii]